VVTEYLRQAPHWTALRCRMLFLEQRGDRLAVDAVMSPEQPDNSDWDAPAGTPFTVVVGVPSQRWLVEAAEILGRWVAEGLEIELRRTRAWEQASQVLAWADDASLLLTLLA
jgi:hypothetical protein